MSKIITQNEHKVKVHKKSAYTQTMNAKTKLHIIIIHPHSLVFPATGIVLLHPQQLQPLTFISSLYPVFVFLCVPGHLWTYARHSSNTKFFWPVLGGGARPCLLQDFLTSCPLPGLVSLYWTAFLVLTLACFIYPKPCVIAFYFCYEVFELHWLSCWILPSDPLSVFCFPVCTWQ